MSCPRCHNRGIWFHHDGARCAVCGDLLDCEVPLRVRRVERSVAEFPDEAHPWRVPLPAYQTAGAVGLDLHAACETVMWPHCTRLIPVGIAIELRVGYEGQIRGRSSLSKLGLIASVGTIDSDYRGEIAVILTNTGPEMHKFFRGDRVGQLVVAPVARVRVVEVVELEATARGENGFGSTGR